MNEHHGERADHPADRPVDLAAETGRGTRRPLRGGTGSWPLRGGIGPSSVACAASPAGATSVRPARSPLRPSLRFVSLLALAALAATFQPRAALARELPEDPLRSVMWESMATRFMPGGEIVFDERVKLLAPSSAENQIDVPITVDATALENVEEIVAVADLNPIPLILTARPEGAAPFLGFRLKLQQSSPVHVGVRTGDGVWHVAGAVVDAAGGGCTAPALAHGTSNWMDTLGETRAQVRRFGEEMARMTLRMRHPMDTGLADGIPAFYLEELTVRDASGATLMALELFEPVSENPTLTLKPRVGAGDTVLAVDTRDTEGNEFAFALEVPAASGGS